MAKLDQEIDRLYSLPIEEFVATRNELSRRLKNEGDTSAADEVKQLVKPNVAAWTINQLSHRRRDSMKALLEAAGKLQKAQEQALQSGGSGAALRRAQAEERQALRELTQHAEEILADSGRAASSTMLNQVSSTLRAAAVSDAGRTALKAGRLAGEVKSSGFDALAGLKTTEPQKSPARDDLAQRRREKEERQRERRELKERARKLATLATEQGQQAERAEKAATEARKTAEKSRLEAEQAAADLEKLGG